MDHITSRLVETRGVATAGGVRSVTLPIAPNSEVIRAGSQKIFHKFVALKEL